MKMSHLDEVELVLDARANLAEGPVWDDRSGELVWVNLMAHEVHRFDPTSGTDRVVDVGQPVGAAGLRVSDGLVLALRDGFGLIGSDDELALVAPTELELASNRMNDGKPDTKGRFWAGTTAFDFSRGAGTLYRLDADLTVTPVVAGMSLSNGLGWSPDDRLMYLIDSVDACLDVFAFDAPSGEISGRRHLVEFDNSDGLPDGMTVDAEGYIWVAMYSGAALRRFSPDGTLDRILHLPVSQPTCCTFGGPDLTDLYITTASQLRSDEELAREPTLGGIFRCRPGVAGLPANRFAG
jgi:sugar lactone lactonase YvrE